MTSKWLAAFFSLALTGLACSDDDNPASDGGGDAGSDAGDGGGDQADAVAETGDVADDTGDASGDADADVEPLPIGIRFIEDARAIEVTPDGRTALVQILTSFEGEVQFLDVATGTMEFATLVGDPTRDIATGLSADLHISALHDVPVQAGVWSAEDDWLDLPSPYEAGCDQDIGAAFDISDDATVVVGLMWDGCAPLAFRWTEETGVVELDVLGTALPGNDHAINRATVVSGDGQVTAGFASLDPLDRSPARWEADGSGELLDPDNLETPGEVVSISYDGSTMAGLAGLDGFVWTEEGGMVNLGRPVEVLPADPVFPNAMTADGGAIFGGAGSEFFGVPVAFVWTEAGGSRALQPLVEAAGVEIEEGAVLMNVLAASDDGGVLLGNALNAEGFPVMFVASVGAVDWE